MANDTISQVEINGTTYDLLDAATRSTVSQLDTRVSNLESYLDASGNVNMKKKTITNLTSIEMYPPANNSNYGGFIDFHYNQNTADYTARI